MRIIEYYKPTTVEEAFTLIQEDQSTIIGGGAWLKLLPKTIEKAIDLSLLNLNQILETEETIEIGAMATLGEVERNAGLLALANGIVPKAIKHIMGEPIRNIATFGGSVAGRFGFSDIITPLLALHTTVEYSHTKAMSLEDFMALKKISKDFITKIVISKATGTGHFKSVKKTSNDFSILNVSVTKINQQFRIAVGARPAGALLAHKAMAFLNEQTSISDHAISEATQIAMSELAFGTNSRATAQYRTDIAEVLIRRGIKEVQDAQLF